MLRSASDLAMATPGSRRNADRTRQAVLDAAERIFARDGWTAATLAAVGAEAGVSRGTPGYFFGSKAGVFGAMADRLVEAARLAAADLPGDARQRVTALLRRQLELVAARPALSRLAVQRWGAGGGPDSEPFAQFERELVRQIAALLDRVPARPGAYDSPGMAAQLVVLCWSAGLPSAPGGSVAGAGASLADRTAVIGSIISILFGDTGMRVQSVESESRVETDLSASKLGRAWRLPGVG